MAMVLCNLKKLHTAPHCVVQFTITDFGQFWCSHVVPNHILKGGREWEEGWGGHFQNTLDPSTFKFHHIE